MKNFLYDFRYAPFKQLFKKYWMVLIFSPIAISALLVFLCGNLWMAMMAKLCSIDFYIQYFPHPFEEFDVEVRYSIPIFLFGFCYTYYPTNHLVTRPHTCGICSGTGHCSSCYGQGLTYIENHNHVCGACGGNGRCATCNGTGISGTEQVLEYY